MSVNCYKLSPESKDRKPILKEDFLIVLGQSLFLSFFFSLDVLCLSLTSVSMYDCNFLCVCISILLRPRVCACVCVFGGAHHFSPPPFCLCSYTHSYSLTYTLTLSYEHTLIIIMIIEEKKRSTL